jgi:hypothetical protein
MPVIVRNYRQYKEWKMPIITLGLKYNEKWFPVDAYVDSGAIYSIFRQSVGERIGLEIEKGRLIYSQVGDGGFIPVFLHELDMVEGFRWALLGRGTGPGPMLAVSVLVTVVFLISGAYYFRRMEKMFADIV